MSDPKQNLHDDEMPVSTGYKGWIKTTTDDDTLEAIKMLNDKLDKMGEEYGESTEWESRE